MRRCAPETVRTGRMNPSVKTKREKADSSDTRETGDTVEHERSKGGGSIGSIGSRAIGALSPWDIHSISSLLVGLPRRTTVCLAGWLQLIVHRQY